MKKIIILLVVISAVLFVYYKINDEKNTSPIKSIIKKNEFKEYNQGQRIQFKNEDWYVLFNSNAKEDYVTLISANVLYFDEIPYVVGGIYETSDVNEYFKKILNDNYGDDNLVEKNGYKIRLFSIDDLNKLTSYEYNEQEDYYTLTECPDYVCLNNTFFATMIDTNNNQEYLDSYNNVRDMPDATSDEYSMHLKYYNMISDINGNRLISLTNNSTLFVRPIINVLKERLK